MDVAAQRRVELYDSQRLLAGFAAEGVPNAAHLITRGRPGRICQGGCQAAEAAFRNRVTMNVYGEHTEAGGHEIGLGTGRVAHRFAVSHSVPGGKAARV